MRGGTRRAWARIDAAERRTLGIGLVALATVAAVAGVEVGRLWRRNVVQEDSGAGVLGAGAATARDTVQVARRGYREMAPYEAIAFNLMWSFVLSFAVARAVTLAIREEIRPFRNLRVSGRHVHHFIPGIALTVASGVTGVASQDPGKAPRLAVPLGIGMGLVFDESALLLDLEDVYWTEKGLVGVQIALATATLLAATVLALRLIRRGEERALAHPPAAERRPLTTETRGPAPSRLATGRGG